MAKCPKCSSSDIKIAKYLGVPVIKCNNCGFDESTVYDIVPEQKTSQKAKGKYSVYKTGGHRRTIKK